MMRKLGVMIGAAGGAILLAGGCELIAGVKDAVPYPADAGTGGKGGGASSTGTAGTGGAGGATSCAPGSKIACYSGPDGTKGVGVCAEGKQTCRMDGSGYDACVGEIKPKVESCGAPEDENCDGYDCVQWAELFGDGADQQATALAVDTQGNIFVAGTFAGEISLNGVTISSMGSTDMFVIKLDPSGKAIWGKAFGDAGAQEGQAITVDSTGAVVVAGITATSVSLGDPQMKVTPPGLFVVKLDGAGAVVWSNGFGALGCGGTSDSAIAAMTVTSGNDVVLAGRYCGTIDFGNGGIPSQMGSQDGFVALLAGGSGSAKTGSGWSRVFGDAEQQAATGVAVGGLFGEIALIGDFRGSSNFGNAATTINTHGGYDLFLARFQVDGSPISATAFGDGSDQYSTAISEDPAGNIVISGPFSGTLNFGTCTPLIPSASKDAYVVMFDASSTCQWSKAFGGNQFFGAARDLFIDASSSNIFLTGIYGGSIDFGAGPIASKGANFDIFLAKLTATGQSLWSKTYDDGPGLLFSRIALSPAMEPILAGFTSTSTNFGTVPLVPTGSKDAFVAKFAP